MTATCKISDEALDAAAADALGANTPADSAAWQQQLAASGATVVGIDRNLRETVARLAAASPYMTPSSELRGKILQASAVSYEAAPVSFRIEDYLKANRDTGRFFRWGFAAAMLFLAAGAWYNVTLKNELKAAGVQVQAMNYQLEQRNVALNNLVSPTAEQISLTRNGKVTAKAFVDDKTNIAVVVAPEGFAPPNTSPQLTLTRNNATVQYHTILVTAPRANFPDAVPGSSIAISAKNVELEATKPTYKAMMGQ